MTREDAKQEVKKREPDFLEKARQTSGGRATYICPACGNGSKDSGTGIALDKKTGRYKCFVCGLHEDVIGLWKYHTGTIDNGEAFRSLYDYYGIDIESGRTGTGGKAQSAYKWEGSVIGDDGNQGKDRKADKPDYMDYFKECAERLHQTDYFRQRGISDELCKKYMLGYEPDYYDGMTKTRWKAVVIPTSRHSYVIRNIDQGADKDNRYRKRGESTPFNTKTLPDAKQPVIIVEGEIDCLSILQAGGEAAALGSLSNTEKFLQKAKKTKLHQPVILALDNEIMPDKRNKVEKVEAKLEKGLKAMGISIYRRDIYGTHKDANEALTADPEYFKATIAAAAAEVQRAEEAERLEAERKAREEYEKTSVKNYLQDFVNGIADSVNTPCIKTGFQNLDTLLEYGLYEGLYTLGALSSTGKTAWLMQIADQIAEQGTDVLVFSLEMARTQLISRSISRLTLMDVEQNGGRMRDAKTSKGITDGNRWIKYSNTEKELIGRAIEAYSGFAGHLYIHEGIGDITVEQVRNTVEKHATLTGRRCVCIVDYLQILMTPDTRLTDKQATDRNVTALKRLSRDFKIPVIAISSFNRENYKAEVNMAAFKESGAVEYSSDALLGMQLKGTGKKGFNLKEALKKDPLEIEVVILKNREAKRNRKALFEYYPAFNYFKDAGIVE